MRICDLCKNEKAFTFQWFDANVNDIKFSVQVSAKKKLEPHGSAELDLCPDCAAKGALAVLGVNPTEPKKETP